MCEMLDDVCDVNREVDFLGDLKIDWVAAVTSACNLVQVINQPSRVFTNTTGTRSSKCIDNIFTNTGELCSKAVSIGIGCIYNNILAISRKARVPTAGPKIVYKRSYKRFCCDSVDDVKNMCWSDVINEEHPDAALGEFMKLLLPIIDTHAPVKKPLLELLRLHGLIRNLKTVWLKEMGQQRTMSNFIHA